MIGRVSKERYLESVVAEAEKFRQKLGPFGIAAETIKVPMIATDARHPDNPIIFVNDSFLELVGYDHDRVLAQSLSSLMSLIVGQETLHEVEAAFVHDRPHGVEFNYEREDGKSCWANLFVAPITDIDGETTQNLVLFHDVTSYKAAEQESGRLVAELKHRVKNSITTVQSIVYQAVRRSRDPSIVREAIELRIEALSRVHDSLEREDWKGVGLNELVCEALEPYEATDDHPRKFTFEGENVRLLPKPALALGIAFNELATNAAKYGAFSRDIGTVSVSWTIEDDIDGASLRIKWQEKGGPLVTLPKRKGFGSRVIEQGLSHELDGEVELNFEPQGVVCTIRVPTARAILND